MKPSKKLKATVPLNSTLKANLSVGGWKYFVCAAPSLDIFEMPLFMWERMRLKMIEKKVQREIPRPPAVRNYNLYMGAVDMFDQYCSYVQILIELRSRKFWHRCPLFWFIIEASLINAWLLYKSSREAAMLPIEYTVFTFRKSIALALVAEWETMGCKNHTCTLSPTKSMQNPKTQSRTHLRKMKLNEGTNFILSWPAPFILYSNSSERRLKSESTPDAVPAVQRKEIHILVQRVSSTTMSGFMFSEISHWKGLSSCRKRLKKHIFLATVYP